LTFSALGLAPELLRAVAAQGYTDPTPVQREAIPHVLAGRDLLTTSALDALDDAGLTEPGVTRLADLAVAATRRDR
jgi:ATP-dependent RNA helicase RhlE